MKYGKIVKVKNKFVSLDTIILPPPATKFNNN